ncbi:MAG: cell division protein FtsL [Clostridium sp.]|nr:cell division protein FtsL [Clostridium sp.]
MAQTRRTGTAHTNAKRGSGSRAGRQNRYESNLYIYDNTARKLDVQRQLEEPRKRKLSNEARKNRDKARHMNFGYLVFLAAALCTCGVILIQYLQLQSELTSKIKNVAKLESTLNVLKTENDEKYNRISGSIDLEEIRRVAIGELGMTYAKEGQIVMYTSEENDYMRKVSQ